MSSKLKILNLLLLVFINFGCSNTLDENTTNRNIENTKIIETGELAAVETRSFVLPRFGRWWYEMKITGMLKHGTEVKAGDSIIQMDPSEVQKFIIDRESALETQDAALEKLLVNIRNTESDLASNLENELSTFELKKLELESSKFETERIRKIKSLEFEQAEIRLKNVKQKIELNKKIQAIDLKIQRLRVIQLKKELKDAYAIVPQLTIRTPISGIFQVAVNRRNRTMIKIGDQVYAGNNMGNVPNLQKMKVNTTVAEYDFMKIYPDQKVIIRMDAHPDLEFGGKVVFISKLCYLKDNKTKQKVFDVEVYVDKYDERLKPGMTVSCEFLNPKK